MTPTVGPHESQLGRAELAVADALARGADSIATLYRAGARIVCSSDAGVGPNKPRTALPHGVASFLPSIGMTNAEAITNVTTFAAEVCGIAERTGTLEVGKDADILAVAGNPLDDITAIHDVAAVFARGEIAPKAARTTVERRNGTA